MVPQWEPDVFCTCRGFAPQEKWWILERGAVECGQLSLGDRFIYLLGGLHLKLKICLLFNHPLSRIASMIGFRLDYAETRKYSQSIISWHWDVFPACLLPGRSRVQRQSFFKEVLSLNITHTLYNSPIWRTQFSVLCTLTKLCNHQHNFRSFLSPKQNPTPSSSHSTKPSAITYFCCCYGLTYLFWTFHIYEVIPYVVLCDWCLPLNLVFSTCIHAVAHFSISFLFTVE